MSIAGRMSPKGTNQIASHLFLLKSGSHKAHQVSLVQNIDLRIGKRPPIRNLSDLQQRATRDPNATNSSKAADLVKMGPWRVCGMPK